MPVVIEVGAGLQSTFYNGDLRLPKAGWQIAARNVLYANDASNLIDDFGSAQGVTSVCPLVYPGSTVNR
jgi:hypothetical protein